MSFGKEDQNLARIGTYGATSAQQMGNAAKRQSGPRKGPPTWANNYQPSEGTPDDVRLIAGDYDAERIDANSGQVFTEKVPWFEYTEHFHGGIKKGMTCSGGIFRMSDRKRATPCRGCDIWREDANERRRIEAETGHKPVQPNRISFSNKRAFIVLDMGWFFKGYRYDENGRMKVGNNGQAYMDWTKYNEANYGVYQATAAALQQQGKAVETQQGLVRSWPVGYTQFNALIGFAEMISKHCKNCGGMDCIHTQGWICPHCSAPTFQGNESTMPADKQKEIINGITMCRNCKQAAYPKAVQHCNYCSNPTPANIFDVNLRLQTIKGMDKNKSQLHLAGVSNPKPIDGIFNELLKKLPDLPKKFAPTPYDEQVALFGPAPADRNTAQFQPQQQQPQQQQGYAPAPGYGQGPGYGQAPAFGGYPQQAPAYSGAQTPPQQWPTQTWNQGYNPGNGNQ